MPDFKKMEKIDAARRVSGLSVEEASRACGISRPTYNVRQANPYSWRLEELAALRAALPESWHYMFDEGVLEAIGNDSSVAGTDCPAEKA